MKCPTELEFEEFTSGAMHGELALRISAHLAACATCSARVGDTPADSALLADLRAALGSAPSPPQGPLRPPADLARYRVIRLLGRGGMGAVYEAEQLQPRRRVALKLIQGPTSERARRRFELESEVLARLDHPGIARVYEAGSFTDAGSEQPFFAMEYVEGQPLADWARGRATAEVVDLVARICDAVQHAHQKGVIHRDLKPGNVLVAEGGAPKVLDFGIARTIGEDEQRRTKVTQTNDFVGTLAYTSPEQAARGASEVDTRSDVYALGAVLYELLAGRLPIEVVPRPLPEALRAIQQDPPPRLSALRPELAGDLETIVAKALEKDPAQRYSSAADLAADLRSFQAGDPIAARAPGAWEQLRRFRRRHRALVAGASAVVLALAAGLATTLVQASRASRAERETGVQRDEALASLEFLREVLTQGDPELGSRALGATLREALDDAARRLESDARLSKRSRATVHATLGNAYRGLGELALAEQHLSAASELRASDGARTADEARALNDLAILRHAQGRYGEALELARRALALHKELFGDADPGTADCLTTLATVHFSSGDFTAAEPLYEQALAIKRAAHASDHVQVANGLEHLGSLRRMQGRRDEAVELYREAHAMWTRVAGAEHTSTAGCAINLAGGLGEKERTEEIAALLAAATATIERVHGPRHRELVNPLLWLAGWDFEHRRFAEAEDRYRRALEAADANQLETTPDGLRARRELAALLVLLDRPSEAEPVYRRVVELTERKLGPDHRDVDAAVHWLASVLQDQGRWSDVEALQRDLLGRITDASVDAVQRRLALRAGLAIALQRGGRLEEAEALQRELLAERLAEADELQIAASRLNLANTLWREEHLDEAEELALAALDGFVRRLGEKHVHTATARGALGNILLRRGDAAEAAQELAQAIAILRVNYPARFPRLGELLSARGEALAALGRNEEAERALLEADSILRDAFGASNPDYVTCRTRLARLYSTWQRPEPAAPGR